MKGYFRVSPIKHNAPGLPEYTIEQAKQAMQANGIEVRL
jgi:hypothetical protein